MNEKPTPTRGRPKTLDRDQVLQAALMEYWSKGPTDVSISDICGLTGTSKPGVYREFGSDDGLKASVLETYHRLAILPLIDILEKDQSTIDAIDALISFMTQDRTNLGVPQGCLFVMMRAEAQQLGPSTCAMRMQREGVPNDTVVSVLGTALRMLVLGEKPDVITH